MKISLEYAHTNLAAIDRKEIVRSAQAATAAFRFLRDEGHDTHGVVLFDDKKVDREEAEERAGELLQLLSDLDAPPDGHYFERDLMRHLPQLSAALPKRQRRDLERSTRSYIRKYDSLPCSVDIALWHSLRLGAIAADPLVAPADVAISILGDSNEESENKARRELLEVIDAGRLSARVIDLYYPERASAPFDTELLLDQLAISLKELTSCQRS